MNRSVFGDGEGVVLAPPSHSHGLSSLHPIPDEGADDQRGKRQQPDIPTCPEHRVVHDRASSVFGIWQSKHHTAVHCSEGLSYSQQNHLLFA